MKLASIFIAASTVYFRALAAKIVTSEQNIKKAIECLSFFMYSRIKNAIILQIKQKNVLFLLYLQNF